METALSRRKNWRHVCRLAAIRLLLAALPLLFPGVIVWAQQDSSSGAAAFAGGQMVRGTVTAINDDVLTVKTEPGEIYQVVATSNTRITKARQPLKVTDIRAGDGVGAMGVLDAPNRTVHAVFIGVIGAEEVKKAREGLGKIYITGQVTAINDVNLSVKRPDGVVQVIQVDESTSFKRGGQGMGLMMSSGTGPMSSEETRRRNDSAGSGAESITLADVKIGDFIGGPGELKGGVFVPTELRVADPATQHRARRAGNGNPAAPPSPTEPK